MLPLRGHSANHSFFLSINQLETLDDLTFTSFRLEIKRRKRRYQFMLQFVGNAVIKLAILHLSSSSLHKRSF